MTTKQDDLNTDWLSERGVHYFNGEFNNENTGAAIEFILEKNFMPRGSRPDHITLVINSSGGDLHDAFALVDIMRGSRVPIHTLGIGCVMSSGLIAFMAGDTGYRTLTPNTSILSHQYSWGSDGKEHELIATIKEYDLTKKRLLNHYKKYTGMTEKQINTILMPPEDVYLDAREAVKYGLADKIITKF